MRLGEGRSIMGYWIIATGAILLFSIAHPHVAMAQSTTLVPAAVMQEAHAAGTVRVILRLGIPVTPEGRHATDVDVHRQRRAIFAAQDRVLYGLRGLAHR